MSLAGLFCNAQDYLPSAESIEGENMDEDLYREWKVLIDVVYRSTIYTLSFFFLPGWEYRACNIKVCMFWSKLNKYIHIFTGPVEHILISHLFFLCFFPVISASQLALNFPVSFAIYSAVNALRVPTSNCCLEVSGRNCYLGKFLKVTAVLNF